MCICDRFVNLTMPRKPKKKFFNFHLRKQRSSQEKVEDNAPDQDSRTSPVQETPPEPEPERSRPARAAKAICTQNLSTIINHERSYSLERARLRAAQRVANESYEQREHRLEDMRLRAAHRMASENKEQREKRLEYQRWLTSQRWLASKIRKHQELQQQLEDQRFRDTKHSTDLEMNCLSIYTGLRSTDVTNHEIKSSQLSCNHCDTLNSPSESVSNRSDINSFGDCCRHGGFFMDLMDPLNILSETTRFYKKKPTNDTRPSRYYKEIEKPRGLARGLLPEKILAGQLFHGTLYFLVKWQDCSEFDVVLGHEFGEMYPEFMISYYERCAPFSVRHKVAMVQRTAPELSLEESKESPTNLDEESHTMQTAVFKMPLTNAEKCRNYRNRKKKANGIKKVKKTNAEKCQMYRLRKKNLAQGYESPTDQVLYTPYTPISRMPYGTSALCVTTGETESIASNRISDQDVPQPMEVPVE